MKLLFLDIDGVLNRGFSLAGDIVGRAVLPEKIHLINTVLQRTGAKVVVISTWKDQYGFKPVRDFLYGNGLLSDSIVGCSPVNVEKEKGIIMFLSVYKHPVEKFVVVDDQLRSMDLRIASHIVNPITFNGLSEVDATNIINALLNEK